MAFEKVKLAFLCLAFICFVQNAVAAPRALAGGEKFTPPRELEIVGHAVAEIAKSFSEFIKSVGFVVTQTLANGMARYGLPLYLKVHLTYTASGVLDTSLTFSQEQIFEYRVLASTLMRIRQKVDLMERFEEAFDSILDDVSVTFLANPLKDSPLKDPSPKVILSGLILSLSETADKHLRQHPELKDVYLRTRDSVKVEQASATLFSLDLTRMTEYAYRLPEMLPEAVKTKMLTIMTNKVFLHHTLNRVIIWRKEYFVMARATLELAKKPNKVNMVQEVYDKAVDQVSGYLNVFKSDVLDISKALFKELASQFEANPSLNQEWREVQRSVSQRHEWDRGIWDLDLYPL